MFITNDLSPLVQNMPCPAYQMGSSALCSAETRGGAPGPPTRGLSELCTLQTQALRFEASEKVAVDELGDTCRVTEVML